MDGVILMGRLTRDPEVRYSQGERPMAIARYTLAVNRGDRRNQGSSAEQQTADFTNCVTSDHAAELAERYFRQGARVLVPGRIRAGSYVNKENQKVCTTEVILDGREFADSEDTASEMGGYAQVAPSRRPAPIDTTGDGFMNIPDGMGGEGLPFNQSASWLVIKEDNTNDI